MMTVDEYNKRRAAVALAGALVRTEWPILNISPTDRMARETLDVLEQYRYIREVAEFLRDFYADPDHTDSMLWHYMKRKYQYGVNLQGPEQLNLLFTQVLSNRQSKVYHPGIRYQILSPDHCWLAAIEPTGFRVSLMEPSTAKLKKLGEPLWLIQDLID